MTDYVARPGQVNVYVYLLVNSEGVVVARESAQYTKVQSLVHTLERDEKRFFCSPEFHGFNRSSDSNLTTIFRR